MEVKQVEILLLKTRMYISTVIKNYLVTYWWKVETIFISFYQTTSYLIKRNYAVQCKVHRLIYELMLNNWSLESSKLDFNHLRLIFSDNVSLFSKWNTNFFLRKRFPPVLLVESTNLKRSSFVVVRYLCLKNLKSLI